MSVILATAGYDHKIRFWEAPSGICSRALVFPDSQVNRLEITRDKQFLAAAGNPLIRIFEVNGASTGPVMACEGHSASVTGVGFQGDGRWMYSCSEDGTVKVWDLRGPGAQRSFLCGAPCNDVVLPADGGDRTLVSADAGGRVKVWDLGTGRAIADVCPEREAAEAALPPVTGDHPEGTGGKGKGAATKAVGEGGASRPAVAPTPAQGPCSPAPLQAVDVSEDGGLLCCLSSRGEVHAYDLSATGIPERTHSFRAHHSYATACRISPDGRHLVTCGSDRTARLWSTSGATDRGPDGSGNGSGGDGSIWKCDGVLDGHGRWVWDAAFSADSSYLVTASSDYSSRLWNLRTGEVVRQYSGHAGPVTCVALNDSST